MKHAALLAGQVITREELLDLGNDRRVAFGWGVARKTVESLNENGVGFRLADLSIKPIRLLIAAKREHIRNELGAQLDDARSDVDSKKERLRTQM